MKAVSLLGRGMNLIISLLVAVSFFACGALITFFFGSQQRQEIRYLEGLLVQDAAAFGKAAAGSEMIVTGALDRNKAQHSSGLVAYAQERWDVTYDSEDGYEGDWETVEEVWPSLLLLTPSGRVKTGAVGSAKYGGVQYAEIVRYSDSSTKAEGIPEGSIRVTGYKNGDILTVVGYKNDAGLLVPTRFYGGTPDALLKEQKQANWFLTGFGAFFMLLSPLILIPAIKQLLTGRV
ncbi:MAG: hypothetical protein JXA89_01815 [Anaerolineae bacterium]|nr:hypothetical protein [Anaerolineae bacterium]